MTAGVDCMPCMALIVCIGLSPTGEQRSSWWVHVLCAPDAAGILEIHQRGAYILKAAVAITIAGSIAVILIAAFVVRNHYRSMCWGGLLVIVVIVYTTSVMLKAGCNPNGNDKSCRLSNVNNTLIQWGFNKRTFTSPLGEGQKWVYGTLAAHLPPSRIRVLRFMFKTNYDKEHVD